MSDLQNNASIERKVIHICHELSKDDKDSCVEELKDTDFDHEYVVELSESFGSLLFGSDLEK